MALLTRTTGSAYPNIYRFSDEVFGELSLAMSGGAKIVIWKINDDQKLATEAELQASKWSTFETILVNHRIHMTMKFSNWDAFSRMLNAVCTRTLFPRLLESGRLSLVYKSYRLCSKGNFEKWKPNVLKLRGHDIMLKPSMIFELLELCEDNEAKHMYISNLLQAELGAVSERDVQ